jgi:hypothetical protein
VHTSWLDQSEIDFSVVQRKALQPNDFTDLDALERHLLAFGRHYEQIATRFEWKFTRHDLDRLLARLDDGPIAPRALSAFVPDAASWRVVVVGVEAVAGLRGAVGAGDFRSGAGEQQRVVALDQEVVDQPDERRHGVRAHDPDAATARDLHHDRRPPSSSAKRRSRSRSAVAHGMVRGTAIPARAWSRGQCHTGKISPSSRA